MKDEVELERRDPTTGRRSGLNKRTQPLSKRLHAARQVFG